MATGARECELVRTGEILQEKVGIQFLSVHCTTQHARQRRATAENVGSQFLSLRQRLRTLDYD